MMSPYRAESLLQAWGRYRLREVEDEVGLPGVSPSCAGFSSPPEWGEAVPPPTVEFWEIERALFVMTLMSSRARRLYRDMREHYVDGRVLGWETLDRGRHLFCVIWVESDEEAKPLASDKKHA